MELSISNKKKYYPWMIGLFILVVVMLFWKTRYGYPGQWDEAYYPTTAYRFLLGDKILYEEWYGAQLYNVLLMPFLKAFICITGSTDGVYYYLRILYTIFKILIALFIFYKLKGINFIGAYLSSLIFLLYCGFGLMVLSYNTFGIGGGIIAILLLVYNDNSKHKKLDYILSGVFISVSVLGIPYYALTYVAYFIAVIIVNKLKDKISSEKIKEVYSFKTFGYVTIGVGICVVLFLIYVLSNTTISQIIETIPQILMEDSSHPVGGLYHYTLAYFVRMFFNGKSWHLFAIYVLLGITFLIYKFDKRKRMSKNTYTIICTILCIILLGMYVFIENYVNYVIFVPNVLAVMLSLVSEDRRVKDIFYCHLLPGISLTYGAYLASNQGFSAISNCSCIATVGSILIIVLEATNASFRQLPLKIATLFLILIIISLGYYRIFYTFWGGSLNTLTDKIETGVFKGIYVTKDEKERYLTLYSDTEDIRTLSEDSNILYMSESFLYMIGDQRFGVCSTNFRKNLDRVITYYELHPDKIADKVYVEYLLGEDVVDTLVDKYGYTIEKKELGWILTK